LTVETDPLTTVIVSQTAFYLAHKLQIRRHNFEIASPDVDLQFNMLCSIEVHVHVHC